MENTIKNWVKTKYKIPSEIKKINMAFFWEILKEIFLFRDILFMPLTKCQKKNIYFELLHF